MTGIGIKVSAPFLNNQTGSSKLNDLKSHMLGWYDVKRQGCTNESLAENPVLEDLSDGQYVFDFNEYISNHENVVSSRVIKGNAHLYYNYMTHDIEPFNIKVSGLTKGTIIYYCRDSNGRERMTNINTDGLYTTPKSFYVKDSTSGTSTGFTFNNTNDGVTITMLPTKHPLELKNFVFGGLSGVGGYGTDLTKWIDYNNVTCIDSNKVQVSFSTIQNAYDFRYQAFSTNQYFNAKCSVDGSWVVETNLEKKTICSVLAGEIADVYCDLSLLSSGYTRIWLYFEPTDKQDYILEILPNFPNSLVFNGVTPEYVINKDNLKFFRASYGEWTSVNVAHVIKGTTNEGIYFLQYVVRGEKGKNLNVNMPSFIIRRTDETKDIYIRYRFQMYNGKTYYKVKSIKINSSSSVIIPALVDTIEPYDEESTPLYRIIFTMERDSYKGVGDIPIDVKLEFLPNYPSPTTNMYGIIPTITHGAKCMIMDFVPTFPINHDGYISYYTQRQQQEGANYVLMFNNSQLANIAYNNFNSNGTYINGQLNNKLRHVDLLNKRQVVSVNANEVYEMPDNRGVVIASDETLAGRFPTMALNSLILFDRELTEEEMKLVMDKLMKYEDTDNIAGDLSRSASVLSLDDSGMYEEYNVYEEGQEIIEAPTEFNDNTV